MEIENSASPMFKDQLHDRLVTEIAEREQTKWRFGWKLASMIIALILVVGFGSIFLKNYFGRDFLRPSKVMAAEIVKKSLESFFRKETIYHQITKQFLEDKTEPIVYEIWEDNDTPRFLNHVTYPASVYPPDGQESWQGFFIETKGSYWWEIGINEKIVRRENYIYNKEEDRWQKLGGSVDVPKVFNELIENGVLEAKEGRLDKREVYVVYDTRTDPDKYWDILTFDKNTFQLLRTEKYEGEGDKRKLTSLVEYELQEAVPATPDNIDKFFKGYPIETKDFKYLQRDFYVNEGGAKEDFKEITSETPFVSTPSPDETANWETYKNTQLGYQIKYPSNYFIKVESLNNIPSVNISNNSDFEKNEFALVITIKSLDNNSNFHASSDPRIFEVLNRIGYQELSNKWGNYISGNFLGDPPWGYYQMVFPSMSINKPSILITIRIHGSDEMTKTEGGTENKISMNAQQILSTFKFTD